MSAAQDAIEIGLQIAKAIASAFGLDEQAVIKVARSEVAKLAPAPADQSKTYFDARKALQNDHDERSELARSRQVGALHIHVQDNGVQRDTDPLPPPRSSER